MRTFGSLLALSGLVAASAFVAPVPAQRATATRVQAGAAGADDEWRNIVGSEANLRQYLGKEGFRYCLNKTPAELEKEGDYGLLEKMFGATSNNPARLAARQYGRALKIDEYDAKKAAENKEWIAKYGYKRWGTSYMDKADLEAEQGVVASAAPSKAAAKPAAAPKAAAPAKPAFSFPFGGGNSSPKAAAPKAGGSAVKVAAAKPAAAAPAAAAPAPKAAAPKAAAPSGPLSAKPASSAPKGNLNLLKKPGSS